MRTPKGTISEAKLVRAFQKGFTVLPDGRMRYSSNSVQEVLKTYSERLENAAEIIRQREKVNWRQWEELGLKDDGWIQFRRTIRMLISTIASVSS